MEPGDLLAAGIRIALVAVTVFVLPLTIPVVSAASVTRGAAIARTAQPGRSERRLPQVPVARDFKSDRGVRLHQTCRTIAEFAQLGDHDRKGIAFFRRNCG